MNTDPSNTKKVGGPKHRVFTLKDHKFIYRHLQKGRAFWSLSKEMKISHHTLRRIRATSVIVLQIQAKCWQLEQVRMGKTK